MKFHEYRLAFVFSFALLSQISLAADILGHGPTNETPISFKDFYRFLREQPKDIFDIQMGLMYVTASDGDEFYNFEQSVSPNCRRIAQALMKVHLNFSTSRAITSMQEKALSDVYEVMKNTTQLNRHPLELFCNETEKLVLQHPTVSSMYSNVKQSIDSSSSSAARKRYFNKIFDHGLVHNYTDFFSIPGFLKATMQDEFIKQANESEAYNEAYNVLAKAIVEVAKKGEYRKKIEKIQETVLSEIKSLIANSGNIFENFSEDGKTLKFTLTMMDKYETYFNNDPNLQRELTVARKTVEAKN